jgi:hypothetical protein
MKVKASHTLTMLLALALASVSVTPALAEPTEVMTKGDDVLVSQLLGHTQYEGAPEMELSDYQIGTVAGKSGEVISVRMPDGTVFDAKAPDFYPRIGYTGVDVLVVEEEGEYKVVDLAHPMWISKLNEDYGHVMAAETRGVPLGVRTASIWRDIEANQGRVATLGPLQSQPYTGMGGEAPVPAMW